MIKFLVALIANYKNCENYVYTVNISGYTVFIYTQKHPSCIKKARPSIAWVKKVVKSKMDGGQKMAAVMLMLIMVM